MTASLSAVRWRKAGLFSLVVSALVLATGAYFRPTPRDSAPDEEPARGPALTARLLLDSPDPESSSERRTSPAPTTPDRTKPATSVTTAQVATDATTVRVVLAPPLGTEPAPVPELLAVDRWGNTRSVSAGRADEIQHTPDGRVIAEFEVQRAGEYAAGWHVWRQVPGTSTFRVCRGRSQTIVVSPNGVTVDLYVPIPSSELELDPKLDAVPHNPRWRATAKDG